MRYLLDTDQTMTRLIRDFQVLPLISFDASEAIALSHTISQIKCT